MNRTTAKGRGLFLAASFWLLIAAIGHSIGHYMFYVAVDGFTPERAALYQTMSAYVADGILNTSMWELLQMFSLSLGLLLLSSSLTGFVLLKANISAGSFRQLTLASALFWLAALLLFGMLHQAIQPIVISAGAVLLYGGSWLHQKNT